MFCTNSPRVESVDLYLNHSDTVKYVGKETCMQCHYDIYQTYIQTGMGRSLSLATKENSSIDLDSFSIIKDSFNGYSYHPFWDNDSLFLSENYLSNERVEHVDYIIGSGHHTNSHLFIENGYLHQMPFTYYTQDSILDFPPGFENNNNSRFDRIIGLECISCHNAYPEMTLGSQNKYSSVPEGIDCERCHGPGELHVHNVTNGIIVDTSVAIDYSIVNPAKLPVEEQFQICMRCHLQGNTVLNNDKSFFDFKPGMTLSDVMTVFVPRYEDDNTFIMASHVDRFKQSKCFTESEDMTCISCHNPHHSVQKTSPNYFNNKCMDCHSDCSVPQESKNCVQCHMPKSSTIDIPHVSISDHKIAIPSQDSSKTKGDFMGLVSINNPRPEHYIYARAYLYQFEKFDSSPYLLDSAFHYIQKLDINNYFGDYIHYYFLKEDYQSIINVLNIVPELVDSLYKVDYQNSHAWTSYRVGQAYDYLKLLQNAVPFYEKANKLAPYVLKFSLKLADVYFNLNQFVKAEDVYRFVIDEYPKNEVAFCNLGFLLIKKGVLNEGGKMLNIAYQLNPRHEQTLLNLASLHLLNNNIKLANEKLKEVLLINPENKKAKYLLQ
ncbi:MAG: tetratricopeptide repeat protein [Flavobacteriales bacterium]